METRFPLPRADYWQLRALLRDVDAVRLDTLRAKLAGETRLAAAQERCRAFLAGLSTTHGLPADGAFTWDDDTGELIVSPKDT